MAGGKIRRTGAKVRRLSYHVGEREHRIWRPLGQTRKEAWRFKDALLRAARRYDDSTKLERGKGAKMGALGLTGIRVLETLCQIVDNMSGRLEPSIDLIAEKARLSRRTVVRALARLRLHGFIDWLRRTVPLEGDGAGPQVEQTTNAYWFALKGRARGLVHLLLGRVPPPAKTREDVQREHSAERAAAWRERRKVHPADVLSPEALAAVRRLAETRGASATTAQSPGLQVGRE
jgi:hypothetical protein